MCSLCWWQPARPTSGHAKAQLPSRCARAVHTARPRSASIEQGREQWNAPTRAKLLTILGNALTTYSDQSGLNEPLLDAIAAHREALAARPRDGAPLDWAAEPELSRQCPRDTRAARDTSGAAPRGRGGLSQRIAGADTRQGAARLGRHPEQSGPRAAPARAARVRSDPASTMPSPRSAPHCRNARASAYRSTGPPVRTTWASRCGFSVNAPPTRRSSTRRLPRVAPRCRNAPVRECRCIGRPPRTISAMRCAALDSNDRYPALLNEALAALYRAALEERTRSQMPLEWAATKNNLGLALAALGQQEANPARLIEAEAAYREALLERTREKAPLDWALTQTNLGTALRIPRAAGTRHSPTRRCEARARPCPGRIPRGGRGLLRAVRRAAICNWCAGTSRSAPPKKRPLTTPGRLWYAPDQGGRTPPVVQLWLMSSRSWRRRWMRVG